jgi:uncharacterized membrane protein
MGRPDDGCFSKARTEMLCAGIFAIAMTLLVLELKVPELPRAAAPSEILRALREHSLAFVGFVMTFILAGQLWILHHQFFHHLKHASRALALLTIPYLMFVSLLPFSTSMLTSFSLRSPVGLAFYFGNQLALAVLLAFTAPAQAIRVMAFSQVVISIAAQRRAKRAPAPPPQVSGVAAS